MSELKKICQLKKIIVVGVMLTMFSVAVLYYSCEEMQRCNKVAEAIISEQNTSFEEAGKCRRRGKILKHKGYFCSENCREQYRENYYNERYGKAICRNCGREFTKPTAYDCFCGDECRRVYYGDLKIVAEAEKFRKSKQNN